MTKAHSNSLSSETLDQHTRQLRRLRWLAVSIVVAWPTAWAVCGHLIDDFAFAAPGYLFLFQGGLAYLIVIYRAWALAANPSNNQ